jgi:hypothetical protein
LPDLQLRVIKLEWEKWGAMMKNDPALQSTIKTQRSMGLKGEHWDNYAIGRDVLHNELGWKGEARQNEYFLDENIRDTLLAHSRQDAAHALCNTKSLLDLNAKLSSQLRLLNFFLMVSVCLLGAIVVKLYPQVLSGLH